MDKRIAKAAAIVIILAGATTLAVGTVSAAQDAAERREERAVGTGLTLAVRVTDANGDPVPGAHVAIVLVKDGEKHRITRDATDRHGVSIFELRPGGYEVHVTSDEGNAVQGVRLHESQRLPITLEPQRGQPVRG